MKKLIVVFFAVFACSAFGQTKDTATAVYASNGTLVGLSNLAELKDCTSKSVDGRLRHLDIEGDTASFRVKKKHQDAKVEINLARLAAADRTVAIRDLIRGSNPVRVAGYTCGDEEVIKAFSIDRVY